MIKNNDKGIVIILVMMVVSLLLLLSMFFINTALNERLIANSHAAGAKTYYLAEAGINEMIWLIKNDPDYRLNFETNAAWSTTTIREDPFGIGSSTYEVTITNTSRAHGEIIAIGSVDIGNGNTAQRVVKTLVYKAIGISVIDDNAGYADGNINISNSEVNFKNGSALSNNVFDINVGSVINVDTDLNAVGNYLEHSSATVNIAGNIYAANWADYFPKGVGETSGLSMPAVDFNSASSTSLYNQALALESVVGKKLVYTSAEFDDWLDQKWPVAPLNDKIVYVTGDVELQGGITLKSPPSGGLLVVEGDFTCGFKNNWKGHSGDSNIEFKYASGTPSGILASRHLELKKYTGDIDIEGVLYANDQFNITNIADDPTDDFRVEGAILGRKVTITSSWEPINIIHNNEIINVTLGPASSSPTIIIEHWEEEY